MTQHPALSLAHGTHRRVIPLAPRHPVPRIDPKTDKGTLTSYFKLRRKPLKDLSFARIFRGGRLSDGGRIGRYALVVASGLAAAWLPAVAYVTLAKPKFTSHFALILPGAGASSSVNVADIGQASSASSSAYSSSTISPTVTYKNLIMSANVVDAAAAKLKYDAGVLPAPMVKLVDETSFISVELDGYSPEEARNRAEAVLNAFLVELNKLRDDEIRRREDSTVETVRLYEQHVNQVRDQISALQTRSGLHSSEQYTALVSATDALRAGIAETEAQLAQGQQSAEALATTLRLSPTEAALAMKLHADPQFSALADAASKAQAAFAETSRQFGARHPKVIEARAHFDGAQAQMMARATLLTGLKPKQLVGKFDLSPTGERAALMSRLVTLATERMGLEGKLKSEKDEYQARRGQVAALVDVAAEFEKLNRDYKVAEAVFASALARINTSKTDIFASYPMVQVVEPPVKPLQPSSPNKKLALAAAGASTFLLLIAAGLGWIRRPLIDKLLAKPHGKA